MALLNMLISLVIFMIVGAVAVIGLIPIALLGVAGSLGQSETALAVLILFMPFIIILGIAFFMAISLLGGFIRSYSYHTWTFMFYKVKGMLENGN